MKNLLRAMLLGVAMMLSSGCVHLSHEELAFLNELEACGISKTDRKIRDPMVAGALAFVPAAGNFYLGVNTSEHWQFLAGAGNFLIWPGSIVWAVPQTMTDANMINMRETAYYYRHDPHGRQYLSNIQKRYRNDPTSTCGKYMPIESFPGTQANESIIPKNA